MGKTKPKLDESTTGAELKRLTTPDESGCGTDFHVVTVHIEFTMTVPVGSKIRRLPNGEGYRIRLPDGKIVTPNHAVEVANNEDEEGDVLWSMKAMEKAGLEVVDYQKSAVYPCEHIEDVKQSQ